MCDHPAETPKFSNLAKALEWKWVKNSLTLSYTKRTTDKFHLLIWHFFAISWFYLSIPGYKVFFPHYFSLFMYLFISIFIFSLPNLCKIVGKFSRHDRFVVHFFPSSFLPFVFPCFLSIVVVVFCFFSSSLSLLLLVLFPFLLLLGLAAVLNHLSFGCRKYPCDHDRICTAMYFTLSCTVYNMWKTIYLKKGTTRSFIKQIWHKQITLNSSI